VDVCAVGEQSMLSFYFRRFADKSRGQCKIHKEQPTTNYILSIYSYVLRN
jgi:hypothetical protein